MAIYSLAQRGTNTVSGNTSHDVFGSNPVKIMEWGIFLGAATSSSYSLRRTTARGTRTTPTALVAEDADDPALTGINLIDSALAFSVQPTAATVRMRRIVFPATVGSGIIWGFPRGITTVNSLSLVIINEATNSAALDYYIAADI